jgi:hypothetical protein
MNRVFFSLVILCSYTFGQRADFFREDITFHLDGNRLDVEGYYWFWNTSNTPIASDIFYPFPYRFGDEIDSVRLYDLSRGQRVQYRFDGTNGISFSLSIAPRDTTVLQIGYRQKLVGDSAMYILRTTQGWGKQLDRAEYKLLVPDSLVIKGFSYPPVKTYRIQGEKIYYWEMDNFMPALDMIFYF